MVQQRRRRAQRPDSGSGDASGWPRDDARPLRLGGAPADGRPQAAPRDGMGEGGGRPAGWGEAKGSFRGVTAYSNGPDTGYWERGRYGLSYQCVEFVNRFSAEVMGTGNMKGTGNAIDYAGRGRGFGYTWIANEGGAPLPEPGDILVFGGGRFGHVAIATRASDSGVGLIQQNTGSAFATLSVSGAGARRKVGPWGSRPLLGWQHHGARRSAQAPAPAGDHEGSAPTRAPTGGALTYTVRPGDRLWAIAARLLGAGGRYREIAALNGLRDPRALRTGQVLRLPGATAAPAPTAQPPASPAVMGGGGPALAGGLSSAASGPSAPKPTTWRVKAGDTLWDIAAEALGDGARHREIARLNAIATPSTLRVGQRLRLPR
jgi:LysM repeat protein